MNTAVIKLNTIVIKLNTAVIKFNTAVIKFNTTVIKLKTAATKFNTSVIKLNTAVIQFNTAVIKFNTTYDDDRLGTLRGLAGILYSIRVRCSLEYAYWPYIRFQYQQPCKAKKAIVPSLWRFHPRSGAGSARRTSTPSSSSLWRGGDYLLTNQPTTGTLPNIRNTSNNKSTRHSGPRIAANSVE